MCDPCDSFFSFSVSPQYALVSGHYEPLVSPDLSGGFERNASTPLSPERDSRRSGIAPRRSRHYHGEESSTIREGVKKNGHKLEGWGNRVLNLPNCVFLSLKI